MKYIGNKTRLITFLESCLLAENIDYTKKNVIDLFAGTGSVSKFFKTHACNIKSCDFMTYSIAEQYRTLYFNKEPNFHELEKEIDMEGTLDNVLLYLNSLEGVEDYFFENFAPSGKFKRQYYSDENAKKIDAIRICLEHWKKLISYEKYMFLVGILMNSADFVSNTAGTYGAYLKIWRTMAEKAIQLEKPEFISEGKIEIFQDEVNAFIKKQPFADIVYIDPPYNSRQYAPNYHLLESLVVYDKQFLKGKTGIRSYEQQLSDYCSKRKVETAFRDLIENIRSNYIILSYSTEGLLSEEKIIEILKTKGAVSVYRNPYRRFKTNSWTENKTGLSELVFICKQNP